MELPDDKKREPAIRMPSAMTMIYDESATRRTTHAVEYRYIMRNNPLQLSLCETNFHGVLLSAWAQKHPQKNTFLFAKAARPIGWLRVIFPNIKYLTPKINPSINQPTKNQ